MNPSWLDLNADETAKDVVLPVEVRRGRWKLTLPERFWAKVSGQPDECQLWTGQTDHNGYGVIRVEGRMRGAHQIAWELTHGPVPTGFCVLHRCDTPRCCNAIKCLFLGTQAQNMADMAAKGRSTRGERSASARLTALQVAEVRLRYAAGGITQEALGREMGVAQTTIGHIVRGVTWKETARAS